jgi:uracil-DNA glycosylase family 4
MNEFEALQTRIIECRECPRLVEWRERTAREKIRRFRQQEYWARPIPAFGHPDASLVLVGLAPAAHGGNRTGRMFTGDRSGDWLFEALHRFGFANQSSSNHRDDGLRLVDAIIVAAVRCAPPGNKPLPEETIRCRAFLRQELRLFGSVQVVVTLGRIAFRAFLSAWRENGMEIPAARPEFRHAGEWELPGGVVLISSYHPSQQNTLTGKLTRPMFHRIFRRARRIVDARALASRMRPAIR